MSKSYDKASVKSTEPFSPLVSWFARAFENLPEKDIPAAQVIEAIRQGAYRGKVEAIRERFNRALKRTNGDRKAAKKTVDGLKKQLPAVTFSGVFGTRAKDQLQTHSGLLQADLDLLGDRLPEIREILKNDPHVYALFLSPTGDGLKAIYRIPVCSNQCQHQAAHNAVAARVKDLCGVEIDATSDIDRLCFTSWDPDADLNPATIELSVNFERTETAQAQRINKNTQDQLAANLSERQRITEDVVGPVKWEDPTTGVCQCPGKSRHTNGDSEKDCKVWITDVPSIKCMHESCRPVVEGLNHTLRSRIAKAEWKPTVKATDTQPVVDESERRTPFPLASLPPVAAKMASAISRTERTPETLSGICVLGVISLSIGAGLQVKSGPARVTRANLYLIGSAESGSGKSETFRHAAKPFYDFEREWVDRWLNETRPQLKSEEAMLKNEISRLEKKTPKDAKQREEIRAALQSKMAELQKVVAALVPPTLACEDVTTEELAVMLAHNDEQLASLSADAGTIVNNILGRYNKLERTDESIYLKAYTGDPHRVNRVSRVPVFLKHPCLTTLWLVQPDKIESLLAESSLTDGGLIPRLLACHSGAQPRPIVPGITGIPVSTSAAWRALIRALLQTFRFRIDPLTIKPTAEALDAMNAHFNRIVERRISDLKDVTIFAARWNEQAWRIAVCIHAGLYGELAGERELELETVQNAIALADWFAAEQLQILSAGREAARCVTRDKVLELLESHPNGITTRDVQRARIAFTADEALSLLEEMVTEGVLVARDVATGGRPQRIYHKARR